jgi:hypothetical protein
MAAKRRGKANSGDAIWRGVMIAAMIATALVFFAASRTPLHPDRPATARLSRAAVNAAEERAIWAPPTTAEDEPTVIITGCLEKHGSGFRLSDPSGASVPKSRSWKSGFLKKSAAAIDLVGVSSRTADAVGTRVRVTGVLANRELQARSLNRIATSC